jgi:hypothetical protein
MSDNKNKQNADLTIEAHKGEIRSDTIARVFTKPTTQAALTIQTWQTEYDSTALMQALTVQVDAVQNGDMERPEAMLLAQAHTLDALFNNLAQRAQNQQYLKQFEAYLRLAFKAQSQCRATLETLATIKNPPVIFAKQANIANGHQQINNGVSPTRTEKTQNQQNELLEANYGGTTLDTRTTSETSGKNAAMATVD